MLKDTAMSILYLFKFSDYEYFLLIQLVYLYLWTIAPMVNWSRIALVVIIPATTTTATILPSLKTQSNESATNTQSLGDRIDLVTQSLMSPSVLKTTL